MVVLASRVVTGAVERSYYNRSVANVSETHITNVYNRTVVNNITVNRVSFNGGEGGLHARPSANEFAFRARASC